MWAPPGRSFSAAAARAEPHPQWGSRNNGGCSSGSEVQPAEPLQSSLRCPGVEPSRGSSGAAPRGRCCLQHRARGGHSGHPRGSQGSARAVPGLSILHSTVTQPGPRPCLAKLLSSGTLLSLDSGWEMLRVKLLFVVLGFPLCPPCRASLAFLEGLRSEGRCQPVSFACERSVELLLGFGVPCMSSQYRFPPLLCRRCSLALQVLLVSIRKLGYIHNR